MKKMKKLMALVAAMVMVLSLGVTAMAATVTVTPPDGTNGENEYTIYKIFDASVNKDDPSIVSYKLPDGITAAPAGFTVDDAGNVKLVRTVTEETAELTDAEIAGIKAYVEANKTELDSVTKKVTGDDKVEFGDLVPGYYYITTTTGTVVIVETNNEQVEVDDKNTVPALTKTITEASGTVDKAGKNAISQLGTTVSFESVITVGKGMESYKFHDTMSKGLALDETSIKVVYSATPDGYVEATPVSEKDVDGKDTITIEFNNGLAEETTITITYNAVVTNDALTTDPETNTAYVEYGNGPKSSETPKQTTNTYSAQISAAKYDGDAEVEKTPLAGAGFKLYKFDTDGTTKLYYQLVDATETAPASVNWVEKANGDENKSGEDGVVSGFVGLDDGTYYLEETTVPNGYNAPLKDTEIIIAGENYVIANLEQNAEIVNNRGSVLPSTGGIGTTIFYVVGAILILGAGVLLITRRRMKNV